MGGSVEDGEKPKIATIREVREETGYSINPKQLRFIKTYDWNIDSREVTFDVFKLKISKNQVNIVLDTGENTKHVWEYPAELHKQSDLMKGLYSILEDVYGVK